MTTIKFKRGSSSRWTSVNPVLAAGEPGYDTTNKKFKIGDGTSTWTQLPFQDTTYTAGDNITIDNGVISATDTTYSAGTNITINEGIISATDTTYGEGTGIDIDSNNDISVQYDSSKGLAVTGNSLRVRVDGTTVDFDASGNLTVIGGGGGTTDYTDLSNKPKINDVTLTGNMSLSDLGIQGELTAGSNIIISDGEISATDTTYTAGTNIQINGGVISATDTTYTHFTGATALADGTQGLVPAPQAGDESKFLCADGTWQTVQGGGGTSYTTSAPLTIDANNNISLNIDSTTLQVNGDNELEVIGGGSGIILGNSDTTTITQGGSLVSDAYVASAGITVNSSTGIASISNTGSDENIELTTGNLTLNGKSFDLHIKFKLRDDATLSANFPVFQEGSAFSNRTAPQIYVLSGGSLTVDIPNADGSAWAVSDVPTGATLSAGDIVDIHLTSDGTTSVASSVSVNSGTATTTTIYSSPYPCTLATQFQYGYDDDFTADVEYVDLVNTSITVDSVDLWSASIDPATKVNVRPTLSVDYSLATNKPTINGVELNGNKTSAQIGVKEDFSFNAPLTQTNVTVQNYGGITYSSGSVIVPYNVNRSTAVSGNAARVVLYDVNYVNSTYDWSNGRYIDVPITNNLLVTCPQNNGTYWDSSAGAILGKYDTSGNFIPKYVISSQGTNYYYGWNITNPTDITNETNDTIFLTSSRVTLGYTTNVSGFSKGQAWKCLYFEVSGNNIYVRCGVSRKPTATVSTSYQAYFMASANTGMSINDADVVRFTVRPNGNSETTYTGGFKAGVYDSSIGFSNTTTVSNAINSLPDFNFSQVTNYFANLNYGAGLAVDNDNLIVDGTTFNATSMQYLSALSFPAAGATALTVTASPMTYTAADNGFIQIVANSTSQHYTYLNAGDTAKQSWSSASGGYIQDYIHCLYGQTVNIAYTAATADVSLYFVPTWGGSQT